MNRSASDKSEPQPTPSEATDRTAPVTDSLLRKLLQDASEYFPGDDLVPEES